jgi:hypothetical protein
MKTQTLLLSFLVLNVASYSQILIDDDNLKGRIKSFEEVYKYVSDNFSSEKFIFHNKFEFDKSGNLTGRKRYYIDGSLRSEEAYTYRKKTSLISRYYEYNTKKEVIKEHYYEYNDGDHLVAIWKVFKGNLDRKVILQRFVRDSLGRDIEQVSYRSSGEESSRSTRKYDKDGRVIESTLLSVGFGGITTNKHIRDESGNVVEYKRYKENEGLTDHWSYEYDDNGNEIGMKCYNVDGSLKYQTRAEYEYDKNNNWTKKISYNRSDTSVTIRSFKYY